MAPICCAPVVLGNDSFLIASTETGVLELPITQLKKCTFRRVSNPLKHFKTSTLGVFVAFGTEAYIYKQNVN